MEEEQDEISLDERIINWVSKNLIKSFVILILTISTILLMVFVITALIFKDKTILNPNEIGDFIGGLSSPIIGLFSAFLIYIAFREQKKANDELIDFNIKQSLNLELNELMFLEEKIEAQLNKINLVINDFNHRTITYQGKDAILTINDNLNNYRSHAGDLFTDLIISKEINLNNFIGFVRNTYYFYSNLNFLLILLENSKINPIFKKILYNNYRINYGFKIMDIDFLENNYKNIEYPEIEESLKLLFKKINEVYTQFNIIQQSF